MTCGYDLSNSHDPNCRDTCASRVGCVAYTTFGTWCALSSSCNLKAAGSDGEAFVKVKIVTTTSTTTTTPTWFTKLGDLTRNFGFSCGLDLSNGYDPNCRDTCASRDDCVAYTTLGPHGTWCQLSSSCNLFQISQEAMAFAKNVGEFVKVAHGKTCGHDLSNKKDANCRDTCASRDDCVAYTTFGTWCALSSSCNLRYLKKASSNGEVFIKAKADVKAAGSTTTSTTAAKALFTRAFRPGYSCGRDLFNGHDANCSDTCASRDDCMAYTTFGTWCALSRACKKEKVSSDGRAFVKNVGDSFIKLRNGMKCGWKCGYNPNCRALCASRDDCLGYSTHGAKCCVTNIGDGCNWPSYNPYSRDRAFLKSCFAPPS